MELMREGRRGVFGTRKRSRQEGVQVIKLESNFSVTVKKLENRGSGRKKPKKKQRTSGGICRTTDCFALYFCPLWAVSAMQAAIWPALFSGISQVLSTEPDAR